MLSQLNRWGMTLTGPRAIVAEVEGEVIAVDMETREVTVRGPAGNFVMIKDARGRMHTVSGVEMAKLDNVRLGDTVVVFIEALVLSLKEIGVER